MADDRHECFQLDRLQRLEEDCAMFHRELFGNGGTGLKEEIVEVRSKLGSNTRLTWAILLALVANLVATLVKISNAG